MDVSLKGELLRSRLHLSVRLAPPHGLFADHGHRRHRTDDFELDAGLQDRGLGGWAKVIAMICPTTKRLSRRPKRQAYSLDNNPPTPTAFESCTVKIRISVGSRCSLMLRATSTPVIDGIE